MLRTNNKEVRRAVRQYIFDKVEKTPIETWDSFKEETKHDKSGRPEQEIFSSWLMGLPSSFAIDYYNADITKILKEWLHETDTEADRYDTTKQLHLFTYLIYVELKKLQ